MPLHADHDVGGDADADGDTDGDAAQNRALVHPGASGTALLTHVPGRTVSADVDSGHATPMQAFLSLLGLGKIPLSLALMIFMLSWGVAGFAINTILAGWIGPTALVAFVSLPVDAAREPDDHRAVRGGDWESDPGGWRHAATAAGPRGQTGRGHLRHQRDVWHGQRARRSGRPVSGALPDGVGKADDPQRPRVVLFDYDREKGVFQVAPL